MFYSGKQNHAYLIRHHIYACVWTLFYRWCFNCELWEEFLKTQNSKVVFTFDHKWWSALSILSIEKYYVQKLDFENIIADLFRRNLEKFNFETDIDLLFA